MADGNQDLSRARICIDFGTALSKASICLDPTMPLSVGVKPLAIGSVSRAEHALLTPSVIFVDGGRIFFGPEALELARNGIASARDPLLSFKTVLGARDLQEALASKIAPSIDPTGTLKQRDALVLYLAYLDQLIREALDLAPNVPPGVANVPRRYTSPVWRPGSGVDKVYERIFDEAAAVSQRLGKLFLSDEGISIAQCKDALDKAAIQPGHGNLETGVFEPHAAAAASLAFTSAPTRFVLVFDMGAGTTDIAAFDFDESVDPPTLSEIKDARQCTALAGDEIDRILIEMHMKRRGQGKNRDEDLRFLRVAKLAARELKRDLFTTGRCVLRVDGRTTAIRAQEFMEEPQFREFLSALGATIAKSLVAVAQRAQMVNAPIIDVVLAGGGSHLPFLPELVRLAGNGRTGNVQLRIGPLSPASDLYDGVDISLANVFPQLAMSIGGALVEMV